MLALLIIIFIELQILLGYVAFVVFTFRRLSNIQMKSQKRAIDDLICVVSSSFNKNGSGVSLQ
jgi:hypothetical protein